MVSAVNRSAFSFGLKEPPALRLIWLLFHSTLYLKLVGPVYRMTLHLSWNAKWLKWLVCGAVSQQPSNVIFAHKRRLRRLSRKPAVKQLWDSGFLDITEIAGITSAEIESVRNYFLSQPAFDSQVPLQSSLVARSVQELEKLGISYASYDPRVSLNNPVVSRLLEHADLRELIDDYLGRSSSLYSVNTMLTFPSELEHGVTKLHRDYDDAHFLVCFVYWTETSAQNGATFVVPGSHIGDSNEGLYLEGRAGSVFLVDTYCLHSGNRKIDSPRLATWMRFGDIPNLAFISDKNYLFFRERSSFKRRTASFAASSTD